jgi:hypothetical protein
MAKDVSLVKATEQDNDQLLSFFNSFKNKGRFEYQQHRSGDFFAPYGLQSDRHETYTLRDKDKSILGTVSFVHREVLHESKLINITTAHDLRIAPSRKAVLNWSQYFLPTIERILAENDYVFSAINFRELTAVNTFVRPRQMRRNLPRYNLFRRFSLHSVHGRLPWTPQPLKTLEIRRAEPRDWEELISYLTTKRRTRAFSTHWNRVQTQFQFAEKLGLSPNDFVIARAKSGSIVGCFALWNDREFRQFKITELDTVGENLRAFLKFAKPLGFSHAMPRSEDGNIDLNFQYLLYLEVQNPDIFESLLHYALNTVSKNEFLVYMRFENDRKLIPPRSWIATEMPYGLYSIIPPGKELPNFLDPDYIETPDIEAFQLI